jgi:hypothetical protein
MERNRAAVTPAKILDYFRNSLSQLSGAPAHSVFDVDEMGHRSWADAKPKICYVPSDVVSHRIRYSVSRTEKRIKLIGCIAADGSSLRPALIVPRATFEDKLLLYGYILEKVEIGTQKGHSSIKTLFPTDSMIKLHMRLKGDAENSITTD